MAKSEKLPQRDGGRPPVDKSLLTSAAAAAAMPAQLHVSAHLAMQQQSGPIPPPEILRKYDEIHPGLAERIIKMAEEEAAHRRIMEREVTAVQARDQTAYRRSELLGQVFGFAIGLAAIGGAALAAVKGAQIAASFIGTAGVTGLVTAFIMGRHALLKFKQEDFRQQQQILQQQLAASSQSAPG
jgi:uncharacterized membrane protein